MVRTACRRFVLPTPQSRWRIDTPTRLETPAGSGAGDIMPFNNAAERALRGIAVGRKNWLFAGSDRGGDRAAAVYTLIATAKLNDVDPQAWLEDVLRRIADHPASRLDELLPWNWRIPAINTAAAA